MQDSATIEWLVKAVSRATRSARFCVAGCLPAVDPGLEVEGVGAVKFPLKRGMAKQLTACCRIAPYGKGADAGQRASSQHVRARSEEVPSRRAVELGDRRRDADDREAAWTPRGQTGSQAVQAAGI